jgi:hypothetical protein
MNRLIAALLLTLTAPAFAAWAAEGPPDPSEKPEQAADKGDRMICKRMPVTGSLVSHERSCKTKREWENVRDNGRSMNSANTCGVLGACG